MPSDRRRVIRHIVKSSQQGNPSLQAIRNWNSLPDQVRFGQNPRKLRRNFAAALPNRYSVQEDLTIGIPGGRRKGTRRYPGEEQGNQAHPKVLA